MLIWLKGIYFSGFQWQIQLNWLLCPQIKLEILSAFYTAAFYTVEFYRRLLCLWDFSGKNTGEGCHFLFQGIFLTQERKIFKPRSPALQQILYPLSHKGSPSVQPGSPTTGPRTSRVCGLLGTRPHSKRWAAGKQAKIHLYLQLLTIAHWFFIWWVI